jgi:hypothetical protein
MRADVEFVMLFDLDFLTDRLDEGQLARLEAPDKNEIGASPDMVRLYEEAFDWLFYRSDEGPCLPGMRRIDITHLLRRDSEFRRRGASLLVSPEYGVAVASVWATIGPMEGTSRNELERRVGDVGIVSALSKLGLPVHRVERYYPFISLIIDRDDLGAHISEHATELGRILTGGYEHQEEQYLRKAILEGNLSQRDYERLYITWTDAMGVYCRTGVDQDDLNRTFFRGLQLYEACIIVSRLFRVTRFRMDEAYASIRAWRPRPLRVNALIESVISAARTSSRRRSSPSKPSGYWPPRTPRLALIKKPNVLLRKRPRLTRVSNGARPNSSRGLPFSLTFLKS